MKLISAAASALAAVAVPVALAATPSVASAATALPAASAPCPSHLLAPGIIHIRLANCVGGVPGDMSRGIRITASGAVQLRTAHLADLRWVRKTTPDSHGLSHFAIKYGTKFLRVNKTGAYLGRTAMMFEEPAGAGFNGPRQIYQVSSFVPGNGTVGSLVLTASGTTLRLAPWNFNDETKPPNPNQVWAVNG